MTTKYTVRFTRVPTRCNYPTQITTEDLSKVLEVEHGRYVVKESFATGVALEDVYVETETEKLYHYKDRGCAAPHISEHLKAVVKPAKKEVLA